MDTQQISAAIESRIAKSPNGFTFSDLHHGLPDPAYLMAERLLQKLRRAGHATVKRCGSLHVWSLTEAGRAALVVSASNPHGELVEALREAEAKIIALYAAATPHGNRDGRNAFAEQDETVLRIRAALSQATKEDSHVG